MGKKEKGQGQGRLLEGLKTLLGAGGADSGAMEKLDPAFVSAIEPEGGLTFRNERYISCGSGLEAVLFLTGYPRHAWDRWLSALLDVEDAVSVLDVSTRNPADTLNAIRRSMEEQRGRMNSAKNTAEEIDAEHQFGELEEMYDALQRMGDVMKTVACRIFVPGHSVAEVDAKTMRIKKDLEGAGFRAAVYLDEGRHDWRAMFTSLTAQNKTLYKRKEQPILSETLSMGCDFHFQSLSDPCGGYFGTTATGGNVFFDFGRVTPMRLSYNGLVVGKMGSGKSTTLKKIILDRAMRGDAIRIFDVVGDFAELTHYLGGRIVSFENELSGYRINVLQIFRTDARDTVSYSRHISKVATWYRYLKPSADDSEVSVLKNALADLYEEHGFVLADGTVAPGAAESEAGAYPVVSDLLALAERKLGGLHAGAGGELESRCLQSISLTLRDVVKNYKGYFDGHTNIPDFYGEQILCFDIVNLKDMEPEIFDAEYYNLMAMSWENLLAIGQPQKNAYDRGELAFEDARRFFCFFDELHRTVNANKTIGVELLSAYGREARKFFGGLWLATQNMRDMVPENAASANADQIKNLFDLMTYKFVMQQDANSRKLLERVFEGVFTESEISRIPNLEKGQAMVSHADGNLFLNIDVTGEELAVFTGGA